MGCIFCDISEGKIKSERIYENENFFSVYDVNPITKGHCLIISKKHYKTMLELPDNLGSELLDCIKKTATKVIEETGAEGFNVLNNNSKSAGQVIEHVHFHVIPRKEGDGLRVIG